MTPPFRLPYILWLILLLIAGVSFLIVAFIYVVEDRILRVYPWMNEAFLVSVPAEVRSAHLEPWQ